METVKTVLWNALEVVTRPVRLAFSYTLSFVAYLLAPGEALLSLKFCSIKTIVQCGDRVKPQPST